MPKTNKIIFCDKCNRYIDKYYYGFHCQTKKHLLGISSERQLKLTKTYTQCTLIFN
jgi:hypothetical protein